MEDIKAVSKVVIMNGKGILFLKRPDSEWELPGGHLIRGERYRDAAKREVDEETGIVITKLKVIFKEKDFVLFTTKPKVIRIKLSDEHKDYKWVNKKSIFKLNISKPSKRSIRHILKCF
jgi:8-oxo-dGTP pyrophosphatase MutT (NUDIX family)